MSLGPGKYDELCHDAYINANAQGVLLIVINGSLGTGFSAHFATAEMVAAVPDMLEKVAASIRADLQKGSL